MNGMQRFVLELEFKSPVHVGMGTDHNHPAYAYLPDIEKREVVLLDPARLVVELDEARRQAFLRAVTEGPARAQRLLQDWHKEGVPLPEKGRLPASPAFLNAVKSASDQAELDFRPIPRSLEGPYLPGSSVKGALRTAWLYGKLYPKLAHQDLVYVSQPDRGDKWVWSEPRGEEGVIKPGKGGLKAAQMLEALTLGYLGNRGPDMQKDPFRAIRLGDSPPIPTTRLERIGVVHPTNRLRDLVILAEVIPEGTHLRLPFRYHEALAEEGVTAGGIDPEALADEAYTFYHGVLDEDLDYATSRGWEKAVEFYRSLKEALEADEDRFPLRLGFGSGKIANTLHFLMNEDPPKTRKSAGRSEPVLGLPLGWVVAKLVKV